MNQEKLREYLDDGREPEGKGCLIFTAIVLGFVFLAAIGAAFIWILSKTL